MYGRKIWVMLCSTLESTKISFHLAGKLQVFGKN